MDTLPAHVGPARHYHKGSCGTLLILRFVGGSVLPRAAPYALIAAGYTAALHTQVTCSVWPSFCSNGHPVYTAEDRPFLFVHTYSYHAVLLSSGFGLVFRLQQSLARYWEARSAAQSMAAKWCDVALMALAFDEAADDDDAASAVGSNGAAERAEFARCVVHLMSLLHAAAMHSLRGDTTLASLQPRTARARAEETATARAGRGCGVLAYGASARGPILLLGGLSPAEHSRLRASAERPHIVLSWVTRLIVRRRRAGGLQVDAPHCVAAAPVPQ